MTDAALADAYGTLIGPDTLRMQRLLPGPIERVWSYLVDADLRSQWLAEGDLVPEPGHEFELVWRNDSRAGAAGDRPDDVGEVHRMDSKVIEAVPPSRLVITWANTGNVTIDLDPRGDEVLLTLTHAGFATRSSLIGHSAGWHAHLDSLADILRGREPQHFWKQIATYREAYGDRYPQNFRA